ncbi:Hypothetical Protein RSKD131_3234 [Cereibacter sphaeroides KD131]|nr:Hypothetical Protein RSKD131_3234 [Cereibacter sphaeroides KD131]
MRRSPACRGHRKSCGLSEPARCTGRRGAVGHAGRRSGPRAPDAGHPVGRAPAAGRRPAPRLHSKLRRRRAPRLRAQDAPGSVGVRAPERGWTRAASGEG